MNEHFIKNIEIKNFKCFDNFKAEGFGRVNLIGGKNNVGKSTLLEALYINLNGSNTNWFLNSIFEIIRKRDNFFVAHSAKSAFNFFKTAFAFKTMMSKDYKNDTQNNINTNQNEVSFSFLEKFSGTSISYVINKKSSEENISLIDFKDLFNDAKRYNTDCTVHFLRPIGLSNVFIEEYYANVQKLEAESRLDESLNIFDNKIKKFKIINSEPQVLQNDEYISITQLGDGTKKLINIFISIYSANNSILLIDELDNGIHYSHLDKLWEIILTISKEQNVQVFATTHSKECIESYARVAEKLDDKDITMTTMARNLKDELKALVWDRAQFFSEMEQNHEVRGW